MIFIDGHEVEPIIGLEVHVQLATRTKVWCACPVEFGARPNSRTCPVCLGLPGALPVLNRQAVELAVLTGLALNCRIAEVTRWDRKSYFYPDLPKNYQISQYELPLCSEGYFELPRDHRIQKIRIRRAHLEEDAGKNVHDLPGCTGVDLNRAGTPLLEIVTDPDLHSAEETRDFAVELQRLVSYLGVSEANMQKGQLRFEPNVNLRIRCGGREALTPIVEIKNLNSFRSLYGAVSHEIARQFEEWRQAGETARVGNKRNRGWDDQREVTVAQREKEEEHEYRYFPDPDLVPLKCDPAWIEELRHHMPELPIPRTERFIAEYKLAPKDAPALVDCRRSADLLDHAAEAGGDKLVLGKQLLSFWSKLANERQTTIAGLGVAPQRFAELANLVRDGRVSATAAAQIAESIVQAVDGMLGKLRRPGAGECLGEFPCVDAEHLAPLAVAERLGLLQCSDAEQVARWVEQALAANPQALRDAQSNPRKLAAARGFLLGQVMKASGGKADPRVVGDVLTRRLQSPGAR